MKLCIVSHSVIKGDGQGRANYEIVWEAIRRGHQVTLIASRIAPDLQQNNQVIWIENSVAGVPTALLREIVFSLTSSRWLKKHRHKFDLIQVYGCATSVPGDINTAQFVHSGWLKSPVHISRQRRDLFGIYQWLYTILNAHWEKRAFAQARVVIAVSKRVEQELQEVGVPQDRIKMIFNGVDVAEFAPEVVHRATWNLPEEVPLALFVGDLRTNRKNLDTVLHALAKVPNLQLAVVGSTEGSPYPQLAKALKIEHRVHFLGYRLDVAEIMKAVNLFVFPSRYEPFGMVVSEAMATGLPVITCKTTGAAEIMTPKTGIVLPDSESVQALAEALSRLANNPNQRREMGKAGRAIAEQHSWHSKAQQYVDLFETVAKADQPILT